MTENKVLLLTSTAPGSNGVGAIILRDLCNTFPKDSLCAFISASGASAITLEGNLSWIPFQKTDDCNWKLGGSRLSRLLRWPFSRWRNQKQVDRIVGEAAAFARYHGVELIWAVLNSPTSIAISRKLADELRIPYVAMIWDDIHHNLPYYGVYRLFHRQLLREWEQTLRQAKRCAVIGETMKEAYDNTFGTDAIILRHGVGPELIRQPVAAPSTEGPIRIGFIGSVTAGTAFQAFIRALDINKWRLCDREVHLRLAGHRFDLKCRHPANIEYLGWRSLEESIAMLSESDFNYLPQPFESHLQAMSRLSFPTKLTTYLAAGRPVLLHSPVTASLSKFNQNRSFGVWESSLAATELIAKMESLLANNQTYAGCVEAGRAALKQEFSEARFQGAFAEFIGRETVSTQDTGRGSRPGPICDR